MEVKKFLKLYWIGFVASLVLSGIFQSAIPMLVFSIAVGAVLFITS